MNRPFFSVIVPAYNAAGFIRKGLDSIRAQSFTDYELIVVCDKCLDNTAEIAREYTDRVVEIDHDVDGRGHNVGLRMAAGRWVLWMDHDDWWLHEYAFQTIAEVLAEDGEDTDILAFGFIMKGVGIAMNCPPKIYPALWNKCWRREFLGDTELPAWDMEIAMMLHPKARFRFFPMPLYYYNFMAPGSLSEKLMKGEVDTAEIPESVRGVFEGYKDALNDGSIHV